MALGTFFEEIGTSIGKEYVNRERYSVYTLGWIQSSAAALFFGLLTLVHHSAFSFSWSSLPFFSLRAIIEVILAHVTCLAVTRVDRSTFSFIRVGTIPLLLIIDQLVGYSLTLYQLLGISLIVLVLGLLFLTQSLKPENIGLMLLSMILPAVTISLYKYNITHYNSVAADQLLTYIPIIGYFTYGACWRAGERPWQFLANPRVIGQIVCSGLTGMLGGYAYLFSPASVIIAARRSSAVLWSIGSGRIYFKETHTVSKALLAIILIGGITILTLSA